MYATPSVLSRNASASLPFVSDFGVACDSCGAPLGRERSEGIAMAEKMATQTTNSRIPNRCARSMRFSLSELSQARRRPQRCESVSIFTADRGSVKLRFRRQMDAALNFVDAA